MMEPSWVTDHIVLIDHTVPTGPIVLIDRIIRVESPDFNRAIESLSRLQRLELRQLIEVVRLDTASVSLSSVQSALYRMSGNHGLMCRVEKKEIVVLGTKMMNEDELSILLRHVNDYVLRENIELRTGKMRDAILGAALIKVTGADRTLDSE
ncbi:MAG: hypothetical protein KGQ60_11350 [Planctomycetes bacterium]|nr:hypothetical protein [Planctomycetota bacterium]